MTSKILAQAIASGTLSGNSTDVVVSSNGAIQLAGNNTTDIFIAPNNNVGIGNTTPADALSVQGSFYQSTNTHTIGTGTYFVSNGYVGIGNTAPTQKIHIQGTGLATSDFRSPLFYDSDNTGYYTDPASTSVLYRLNVSQTSSGVNGLLVNMPTDVETTASGIRVKGYSPAIELMDKDSVQNWYMGIDDNDGNKLIFGRGYGPGQSVTQAITVDTSDNVGIGTSAPSYKLHVYGSGDPTIGVSSSSSGQAGQFIAAGNGASSYPGFNLYQDSTGYWSMQMRADTNLYLYRQSGSGNVIVPSGSIRTPIVYDYNDTGYYIDPASTSVVNQIVPAYIGYGSKYNGSFLQTAHSDRIWTGGSPLLGDGAVGDVLAFRAPSTAEYYNGSSWSSATVVADAFIGKNFGRFGSNYSLNTTTQQRVRFTWNGFGYHFFDALLISGAS